MRFALLCAVTMATQASALSAQMRPTERAPLERLGESYASCGAGYYVDQAATRAGTRGTMTQLGECTFQIERRDVTLRVSGIARRLFHDESQFATPAAGVYPGPRRWDVGEWAAEILLPVGQRLPTLRVGVRLPTTNDRTGMERDATDFYATLAGIHRYGPAWLSGEAGVGIHGTRNPEREQQDVLLYAAAAGVRHGRLMAHGAVVGHTFWLNSWTERGNENLAEARLGLAVDLRDRWFLEGIAIRGLSDYSPSGGVRLFLGRSF